MGDSDDSDPGRCLIFDSYYDPYRGVVAYFRVVSGRVLQGEKIRFMNTARRCWGQRRVCMRGVLMGSPACA
jgi:translation elongation factor EF-4